ncbi:hypothetical protein ACWD4B_25820 [Streptomyces sp. NPDC002536]
MDLDVQPVPGLFGADRQLCLRLCRVAVSVVYVVAIGFKAEHAKILKKR